MLDMRVGGVDTVFVSEGDRDRHLLAWSERFRLYQLGSVDKRRSVDNRCYLFLVVCTECAHVDGLLFGHEEVYETEHPGQ